MQLATLMPYDNDRVLIMSDHKAPSVQNIKRSPTESPWKTWGRAIMFLVIVLAAAYSIKWAIESKSLITFRRSVAGLAFFATLLAYTEKCLKYSYEKWADVIGTLALALAAVAAGLAIFV